MSAPTLSAIWAQSESGVIGHEGGLPWHAPTDLKHFKAVTLGKPILMGRATFDSIGRPLPGRQNIVLSRTARAIEGATVVRDLNEALAVARGAPELMVIGGAQVYALALPQCTRVYRTLVSSDAPISGDTFLPGSAPPLELPDQPGEGWWLKESQDGGKDGPYRLRFQTLQRG